VTDDALAAEVELLAAENRRLKREAVAGRRSEYRRTALWLAAVGLLAAVGAAAFPASRTVLTALAGVGLFGAVLTYFLTPERFVSAATSERVYAAYAASAAEVVADLGLAGAPTYVRTEGANDFAPVRLYVPRRSGAPVPPASALELPFVVGEDDAARGVTFTPVGAALYAELRDAALEPIPTDPAALGEYLASALVDAFELAGDARATADTGAGRLVVAVTDSAYGPVDRFDHPVVSLLAAGVATAVGTPVEATTVRGDADDWLVTLEWAAD
jgi:hypothetical protein